ncbi:MAG TPA: sensor histidine kinase [Chthoniobacter sp.]|nr:sensor histidine kinase [Chthoniobacter sp.]
MKLSPRWPHYVPGIAMPLLSALSALGLLIAGLQPTCRAAEPGSAISRIREVRTLNDEALSARPPVRLRGVVLHRYPTRASFILQDESDAIFVDLARDAQPLPENVDRGAVVEIEGMAKAGKFAPDIIVPSRDGLRVVGTAPLPAPVPLTAEAAQTGVLDVHRVTAEGVVRRAPKPLKPYATPSLEMVFENTRLFVYLMPDEGGWDDLVDGRIRVTGIASGSWNKYGQITAPCIMAIDRRDITVLRPAPKDPFALPAKSVADILRYRPEDSPGHRIHITGLVLHALADGRVFVFDSGRAICVECGEVSDAVAGDVVDVFGFPYVRERRPLLEDAVLKVRSHHTPLPTAISQQAATIAERCKDYELVQVQAALLETQRSENETDLLLQSEGRLFKAMIDGPDSTGLFASLKPGSMLSLSGLVLFSFPARTTQTSLPNGFSLLLRSASDVRVIQQPPWWTARRLLGMLSGAVALVLVFALWNHFLRARSNVQQEIIRAQTRREATSEERARVARELHDTLEQEFVGMTRQTEAVEHAGPLTSHAHKALGELRQMLQFSRDNARRAVWDLRDPVLLDGGLEPAIRNAVQRLVGNVPVDVSFQVDMSARAFIPPNVQINVLRLAQEAVTNAIKHSRARTIEVILKHSNGAVVLGVNDDGPIAEGSDVPLVTPAGHFGIIGMRERCEKLGGVFEFHAQPGGGASVRAQIPIIE